MICSIINFKICVKFIWLQIACCALALKHAPLTCEGFGGFKKGDKGDGLVTRVPLSPFWIKEFLNLRSVFLKIEIYYRANFKISLTRKNWLLKFGFAHRLAQILEPKLLAHEILKFAIFLCRTKDHFVYFILAICI